MAAEEPVATADHLEGFVVLTQSTLGQLISKPRLLPERLRKPPFRFLFDVVAEVARQTGFGAAELFGGPPGEKVAPPGAREEKVAFIQGWIALAAATLGEQAADLASVSPVDIVCGVRPEWTNYLLQCTAAAAWPDSLAAPPSPSQLDPSLARAQAGVRAAEAEPPPAAAEPAAAAEPSSAAAEPEGAAAAEAPAAPAAAAADLEAEAAPEVLAAVAPAPASAEVAAPELSAEEAVAADEGLRAAFEECDQLQEAFASTFAQTAGAWRPGAPAAGTGGAPFGPGGQAASDSDSDSGAEGGAEGPTLASTQVLRQTAAVTSKIDCELQQAQDLLEKFEMALDQDEEAMEQRRGRVQALREAKDASARAQAEAEAHAAKEAEAESAARKSKRRAEKAARKAREAAEAQERPAPARESVPAQSFPVSATTRALGARMVACTGGDEEYAQDGDAGEGGAEGGAEGAAAAAEGVAEAPAAVAAPSEGDLGSTLDAMLAADEAAPAAAAAPAAGAFVGSEGPLFNRLKAEMKETFVTYLCATMPEALIRKYSHDELIGCLQLLLKELRRCLELHGLQDVQDEDSTELAEELRVNFPNDWLPHLQGASPWALRQKYNMYELIDTLQGLVSACSDRLQDELGPLSRWAPEGSPLRCDAPPAAPPPAATPPPAARAVSPAPAPQARPATGLTARPKPWEGFGQDISAASQTSTRHRASPAAPAAAFNATLGPAAWEVQQDAPGAGATAGQRLAATAGPRAVGGGQGPPTSGRPRTQYHGHALASR